MNMMPYLLVARTHEAYVSTPNFDACVRQATILSLALSLPVRSHPYTLQSAAAITHY